MGFMNLEKFLGSYTYAVGKDFDVEGTRASWADSDAKPAHRFWDDEDHSIKVSIDSVDSLFATLTVGTSHDEKFIAISSGLTVVVLDTETKEVRTEFKGVTISCANLTFGPTLNESGGYMLAVGSSDLGEREQAIIFLDLDHTGRRKVEPEVIDLGMLLELSLHPVVSEMEAVYGVPSTERLIKPVREDYAKALQELGSKIEAKDLVCVEGGIAHFGSKPFSADGKLLLYLIHNQSTQQGMRPPEELPQVVIYDVINHTQKHVLGGHEDAIMWTGFSPDGQYIATAAWDGTFRIFEVDTGDCKHIIGPTGGQCWTGAWSPDSKNILLCGMAKESDEHGSRVFVAVYSTESAQQINRFYHEHVNHWVREVAWSERGEIAIAHKTEIWIWDPFTNKITSSFALRVDDPMLQRFASVRKVEWVQGGDVLIARTGDGTVEVWNRRENVKWRVQRPQGLVVRRNSWWMEEEKAMVSLDGEGVMRFYRL